MSRRFISFILSLLSVFQLFSKEPIDTLDQELNEVVITERRTTRKLRGTASNTETISAFNLKHAACCNLGESFTTNPSVDVSYNYAGFRYNFTKYL